MVDKTPLVAGLVILLAIIGTTYYITNLDQTYYCETKNVVSMCFKLSNPTNNLSSRCYYNESIPTKYYTCTSGWKPIKDFPDIMANLTGSEVDFDNVASRPVLTANAPEYGKIEIKNSFMGIDWLSYGQVADIELTDNYCSGLTDCYAILKVNSYDDDAPFINAIEFSDINGKENTLNYNYEYISGTKEVDVNDYKRTCEEEELINHTIAEVNCVNKVTGTHKETQNIWSKMTTSDKFLGERTIRIHGVKPFNKDIDWKITIRDVKLNDWAWWITPQPNAFWKFEQSSGDALPSDKYTNITLTNLGDNVTYIAGGKFGNASNFSITKSHLPVPVAKLYTTNGKAFSIGADDNFTYEFWVRNVSADPDFGRYVFGSGPYDDCTEKISSDVTITGGGVVKWQVPCDSPQGVTSATTTILNGTWHLVDIVRNGTGTKQISIWVDGVLKGTGTNNRSVNNTNFALGADTYDGYPYYGNYQLDNFAIWNSTALSPEDIVANWNSGVGREIDSKTEPSISTTVNLTSPPPNYNSTVTSLTFNCSANSTGAITSLNLSVNGIDVNSVMNSTDFENLSLQYTKTSLPFGWGNWTCYANNKTAQIGYADNRSFFIITQLSGKVTTSNGTSIPNAVVLILYSNGTLIGNTTSNETGGWVYATNLTSIINWTVVGYNPNNKSQGGNAYPFINQ